MWLLQYQQERNYLHCVHPTKKTKTKRFPNKMVNLTMDHSY